MLSVTTLKGVGADLVIYYEKEAGNKDYWSQEAQKSTEWLGHGAQELGLAGAVEQEQFEQIMDRQLPDGTQLPRGPGGISRMGFDLTYSASKSLSIAALVGGDLRLIEAHQEAVRDALEYVEREVLTAQYKQLGIVQHEKTGRLVAAVFQHETSRELDPQLHSHAVVANLARTADGKWRALDGADFYKHKMAAGAVYRASLAERVQKLGYQIERTHSDGRFELKGISRKQVETFSKRRAQIEAELAKSGRTSARAAEVASLSTRKAKESGQDKIALRDKWRAQAKSAGIKIPTPAGKSLWKEPTAEQRASSARDFVRRAEIDVLRKAKAVTPEKLLGRAAGHSVASGVKVEDLKAAMVKERQGGRLKLVNGKLQAAGSLKREVAAMNRGIIERKARSVIASHLIPSPIRTATRLGRSIGQARNQQRQMTASKMVEKQVGKAIGAIPGIGPALKIANALSKATEKTQENERGR